MARPTLTLTSHDEYTGDNLAAACSLREHYAGLAMAGLLSYGDYRLDADKTARTAVACADALIAALGGEDE